MSVVSFLKKKKENADRGRELRGVPEPKTVDLKPLNSPTKPLDLETCLHLADEIGAVKPRVVGGQGGRCDAKESGD